MEKQIHSVTPKENMHLFHSSVVCVKSAITIMKDNICLYYGNMQEVSVKLDFGTLQSELLICMFYSNFPQNLQVQTAESRIELGLWESRYCMKKMKIKDILDSYS